MTIDKRIIAERMPSPEVFEKMERENYERKKASINNFSYWFPRIKNCGFDVPDSVVIPISFEWYHWLCSDSYTEEKIHELTELLKGELEKSGFNYHRTLFMKNNDFSNKFDFRDCRIDDISKIGKQFLNINYAAMCLGAGCGTEAVIREFIEDSTEKPSIYEGMPLNCEFRMFYDFDEHRIVDIFCYWDKDTMESHLSGKELQTYISYEEILDRQFKSNRDILKSLAEIKLVAVGGFSGIWSIDFMTANGRFYLIDMATAERSYYYERIADYVTSKAESRRKNGA